MLGAMNTSTLADSLAPVTVRRAHPADAHLVDTMVREIATHEDSAEALIADIAAWESMLARSDVTVLLAYVDDMPAGYASTTRRLNLWLATEVVALDDLWVRAGQRDRGIGAALMRAVADLADGATVVWGARVDNEAAHRFYRRLGAELNLKVVAAWRPSAYRAQRDRSQAAAH
jgi:ribosomal protein S18 acetylase RimI-like enzyme